MVCIYGDWSATDATVRWAFTPLSWSFHFVQRFLQRGRHRYGVANDADPGLIPDELLPVLDGLTQMEEMLCNLASPCFLMWVSKGSQYKTRGNVITFPQDIAPLCPTLPRLPKSLDVLLVRKPHARSPNDYKDFRVRKVKVLAFLRYLKENNPYYADVVIQPSALVDLPADGDISDRLPHVGSVASYRLVPRAVLNHNLQMPRAATVPAVLKGIPRGPLRPSSALLALLTNSGTYLALLYFIIDSDVS